MAQLNHKSENAAPALFPLFLKLEGRECLVVGAGSVAEGKIRSLLASGAKVRVVALEAKDAVRQWAQAGEVAWEARAFQASDLDGVVLAIAATSSPSVNAAVFVEARKRNVLCNAVDDPENCDFYYGAVVRRGDLQIAISTAGHSPALAQRLRQELEEQFTAEYSDWVKALGEARQQLFALDMDPEQRRRLLHEMTSAGPGGIGAGQGDAEKAAMPEAKEVMHAR